MNIPYYHRTDESGVVDLDRLRDAGEWIPDATYQRNDVVTSFPYTSKAETETSDPPYPIPQGQPAYIYDGTSPTSSITAKSLLVANTYTLAAAQKVISYRVYMVAGNQYSAYWKNEQTGRVEQLWNLTATQTGWQEFAEDGRIFLAGESLTLGLHAVEPDPSPTVFSGNWDYSTPNNASAPGAGEITHANRLLDSFRVHKTDNDGGDRSAELATLTAGDTIDGAGMSWAIQTITDQGTYIDFTVAPAQQGAPDGVQNFDFETTTSTPITTVIDPDYYLNDARVQPFYRIDGGPDVQTDDAYGIDVEFQQVSISPDWRILAISTFGT